MGQEKFVYKSFDEHWRRFEKYSVISRLIMNERDRPIAKMLSEISPKNILDIGCGIGRTILKFKKLGLETVGIDNSESSIALCERKGLKIGKEIIKMNADSLRFSNSSFDVVFAEGLLEHFENYEPFVKEMVRVSRKYVLLLQPNAHSVCGKILNLAIEKLTRGNVKEIPYQMEDYIKSFEKYGCKLVKSHPAFFNAFAVLLFQK